MRQVSTSAGVRHFRQDGERLAGQPRGSDCRRCRSSSDPKQIAEQARRTARHYTELSQRLAALRIEGEELAPRVKRYEQIADSAALTLREVADALDHDELEKARQKRVDFDTVAQREPLLVKEINDICR